jgi:hypothetical protein
VWGLGNETRNVIHLIRLGHPIISRSHCTSAPCGRHHGARNGTERSPAASKSDIGSQNRIASVGMRCHRNKVSYESKSHCGSKSFPTSHYISHYLSIIDKVGLLGFMEVN